jgi:hypothetical protein
MPSRTASDSVNIRRTISHVADRIVSVRKMLQIITKNVAFFQLPSTGMETRQYETKSETILDPPHDVFVCHPLILPLSSIDICVVAVVCQTRIT